MALLTVSDFRGLVNTSLGDAAIQGLLNDAEQAIVGRFGAVGTVTDVRAGGGGQVQLSRRAASISSISEQWLMSLDPSEAAQAIYAEEFWLSATALSANDYALSVDGMRLQRLADGTHQAETWGQFVKVTYTAFDDTVRRRTVQMQLVKLELNYKPGVTLQQTEGFQEQYSGDYDIDRERILNTLAPGWSFA